MVASCCVSNCANRFKKSSSLNFYRIPKINLSRRQRWILAINRQDPKTNMVWIPSDTARICSKHFISGRPSADEMHPDYIPSICMGTNRKEEDSIAKFTRSKRTVKRKAVCLEENNVMEEYVKVMVLGESYVESTSLSGDKQQIKSKFSNSSDNRLHTVEENEKLLRNQMMHTNKYKTELESVYIKDEIDTEPSENIFVMTGLRTADVAVIPTMQDGNSDIVKTEFMGKSDAAYSDESTITCSTPEEGNDYDDIVDSLPNLSADSITKSNESYTEDSSFTYSSTVEKDTSVHTGRKRCQWSHETIQLLLTYVLEEKVRLKKTFFRKTALRRSLVKLKEAGYDMNFKTVYEKWRSLSKTYRNNKRKIEMFGGKCVNWDWYEIFDKISAIDSDDSFPENSPRDTNVLPSVKIIKPASFTGLNTRIIPCNSSFLPHAPMLQKNSTVVVVDADLPKVPLHISSVNLLASQSPPKRKSNIQKTKEDFVQNIINKEVNHMPNCDSLERIANSLETIEKYMIESTAQSRKLNNLLTKSTEQSSTLNNLLTELIKRK